MSTGKLISILIVLILIICIGYGRVKDPAKQNAFDERSIGSSAESEKSLKPSPAQIQEATEEYLSNGGFDNYLVEIDRCAKATKEDVLKDEDIEKNEILLWVTNIGTCVMTGDGTPCPAWDVSGAKYSISVRGTLKDNKAENSGIKSYLKRIGLNIDWVEKNSCDPWNKAIEKEKKAAAKRVKYHANCKSDLQKGVLRDKCPKPTDEELAALPEEFRVKIEAIMQKRTGPEPTGPE